MEGNIVGRYGKLAILLPNSFELSGTEPALRAAMPARRGGATQVIDPVAFSADKTTDFA